ncbi:hypothetical protein BJX65DRAFT_11354 [Aspergillus insuetus]
MLIGPFFLALQLCCLFFAQSRDEDSLYGWCLFANPGEGPEEDLARHPDVACFCQLGKVWSGLVSLVALVAKNWFRISPKTHGGIWNGVQRSIIWPSLKVRPLVL